MSADNYWLIRKDNFGKFVPVMGFMSNEQPPFIRARDPRFDTIDEAILSVENEYSEYGTSVHPECHEDAVPRPFKNSEGHYLNCNSNFAEYYDDDPSEAACNCLEIEQEWNTYVEPVTVDPAVVGSSSTAVKYSAYSWIGVFDHEDRDEFLKEVRQASSNSVEALIDTLNSWKTTADALRDPAVRENLLNPVEFGDFGSVERP